MYLYFYKYNVECTNTYSDRYAPANIFSSRCKYPFASPCIAVPISTTFYTYFYCFSCFLVLLRLFALCLFMVNFSALYRLQYFILPGSWIPFLGFIVTFSTHTSLVSICRCYRNLKTRATFPNKAVKECTLCLRWIFMTIYSWINLWSQVISSRFCCYSFPFLSGIYIWNAI